MSDSLFLSINRDSIWEQATNEFLSQPIQTPNPNSVSLYNEIRPDLSYQQLLDSVTPHRGKSLIRDGEVILRNKFGTVLYVNTYPIENRRLF